MKHATSTEFKPPFDVDEDIDHIFESKINDEDLNESNSNISDNNALLEDLIEDILKSLVFFIFTD